MRILVRWAFMVLAISAAVYLVPGITLEDDRAVLALVVTAVILGLLNAVVRPVLAFLTCGFIVLTLGIGLLFINGLMLYWASWIAQNWFDIGFVIDGYWPAFWGALVISIVSFVLNAFIPERRDERIAIWREHSRW